MVVLSPAGDVKIVSRIWTFALNTLTLEQSTFFPFFSLLVFRRQVATIFEFFGFTLESVWCTFSQGWKIISAIQRKLRQIFILIRISRQNLCLLCFINDFESEVSKELPKEIFNHLLNCETKQEQEVVFRFKLLMQTDALVLCHAQL